MNPLIFESTFITVESLWFFTSLAIFVGFFIFIKLAQRSRLRLQFLSDLIFPLTFWSLVFGRLFAVFNNSQYYFYDFSLAKLYQIIAIWNDKEISFWGAMIGAIFLFIKKANHKQENLEKWSDIFAISFLFSLAIGNLGTYFAGINYGKPTSLFWGITFNNPIVIYTSPIHPTQIYSLLYTSLIGLLCYRLYKKYKNHFDGISYLIGLSLFSFFKVLEGFFRGDIVLSLLTIRLPEICFFLIFLYATNKLYRYQKIKPVPFLQTYTYYYSKLLNLISR